MPPIIPVPVLSPSAWVTSTSEKADAILAHFFEANKSQTALYGNNVSSLQYVIEQYGHNVMTVSQQLQNTLEKYLSNYYDLAVVTITNNNDPSNLTSGITLTIHATVTDAGIQYSIGYLLETNNSKVISILKINNG